MHALSQLLRDGDFVGTRSQATRAASPCRGLRCSPSKCCQVDIEVLYAQVHAFIMLTRIYPPGSSAHIRQLLYIALYPPPSLEDQIEEEVMKLEPGSPSKLLSRRHKSSLAPSPKAAAAAQDLLTKFARTNTPESLACALPSYPDSLNANPNDTAGSEDSHIAREALRVRNARCCWDIIKEGFIPRGNGDVTASPQKPKGRRSRRARVQDDGDEGWEGEDTAAPAPVSDHAWSALGWILTLFENNEAAMERNGQGECHSPVPLGAFLLTP